LDAGQRRERRRFIEHVIDDQPNGECGSSAGSAVAAAASFCTAAIGTETNGSILSPSSLNGLVGLKPTVGVVPISPRQDTAGAMCRTVADAAVLAAAIAERPLGFGAHGTDLEGFRMRGVRIGAMPVRRGHIPTLPGCSPTHAQRLRKRAP